MAGGWWDPSGPLAPLHRLNPTRLQYIRDEVCAHYGRDARQRQPLAGLTVLDVGCGGGLVTEPLTRLGGRVTGLDASTDVIGAARAHAAQSGLSIDYRAMSAEALAEAGETFDVVLALEIVEHVADVEAFLTALRQLTKPGGGLIVSTLNRTAKSFALGIVAAEYLLGWVERGTHDWRKFLRPDEFAEALDHAGFTHRDWAGLSLDPLTGQWSLSRDLGVNYIGFARG